MDFLRDIYINLWILWIWLIRVTSWFSLFIELRKYDLTFILSLNTLILFEKLTGCKPPRSSKFRRNLVKYIFTNTHAFVPGIYDYYETKNSLFLMHFLPHPVKTNKSTSNMEAQRSNKPLHHAQSGWYRISMVILLPYGA